MMMRNIRYITLLGCLAAALNIQGCGDLGTESAPDGSTITISPTSKSWTSGVANFGCPSIYSENEAFSITLKDSTGKPLNGIELTIDLDLSPGNSSVPIQILHLFDEGIEVEAPYTTKTDKDGKKNIQVQADLGCTYRAELSAFSGTAFSSSFIEVTSGAEE